MKLTHINENNNPKMVNVGAKNETERKAIASGQIKMSKVAFELAISGSGKKGPVEQTAVISAILGAKKTSEIITMAHPILINGVDINVIALADLPGFRIEACVMTSGKTGVEMEALTAVSVGLLNLYDMLKAADKSMEISDIRLDFKSGGKSGDYKRADFKEQDFKGRS